MTTYWGVDPQFREVVAGSKDESPIRCVYFSRLTKRKGAYDLIDAFKRVDNRKTAPWELDIVGWGNDADLRANVAAAGLTEKIHFLGHLERDELLEILRRSHIAVLPSYAESFGLSVVEALTLGLPVVAYAVGALPELVQDGINGCLSPPGDIASLADAITDLINSPDTIRKLSENCISDSWNKFNWSNTVNSILEALGC